MDITLKYLITSLWFVSILLSNVVGHSSPLSDKATEVVYSGGNLSLKGYLCTPTGPGPFPAVLYNHGGLGDRMGGAPRETCEALAQSGYVGFSPMRRQTIPLDGHLDDVFAGIDYVKKLTLVDPERIGLIGFSRGALLTFMAASQRDDLKAIVMMGTAWKIVEGPFLSEAPRLSAPVLLLVSENDTVQADHVRTTQMVKRPLDSAGKENKLITYLPYGRDGHQMFFEVGGYWKDIEAFLRENL